jgi:hypothetical protein
VTVTRELLALTALTPAELHRRSNVRDELSMQALTAWLVSEGYVERDDVGLLWPTQRARQVGGLLVE